MWNTVKTQHKQGIISRWLERRRASREDMETHQFHWVQTQKVTEPQLSLDVECMRPSHVPKDAKSILPKEAEIEIRFISDLPNTMANIHLYAARKQDDICQVAAGSIKSGGQATDRGFYIDSITLNDTWLSPITVANSMNGMARILLRTHGYNRIFVRINGRGVWYVDMAGMSQ